MRYGMIPAIVLCGAAAFSAVALLGHVKSGLFHSATAAAQTTVSATSHDQSKSPLQQATEDLESLLAQASDTNSPPDKMFTWFTKCDLGLQPEPCTHSDAFATLADTCASPSNSNPGGAEAVTADAHAFALLPQWTPSKAAIDVAMDSLEPAMQRLGNAGQGTGKGRHPSAQAFSSVLYNPQAACAIRQLGKSQMEVYANLANAAQSQNKPNLNFPEGATVVKLIWEVAPKIYQAGTTTQIPAVVTGNLGVQSQSTSASPHTLLLPELTIGSSGTLPAISQWVIGGYVANIAMGSTNDTGCTDPSGNAPYSPSCFTWIYLGADGMSSKIAGRIDSGSIVTPPGAPRSDPGYLVLVGINVMKIHGTNQQWLFSSFWWAKQRPQPALSALSQWAHFSGCAVQQPRSGPVTADNLCLNPYLEGLEKPNGAYSNCANCHNAASFQAGSPSSSANSQSGLPQHTAHLNCTNLLARNGNPPVCNSQQNQDGTGPTADTHQLWSLADIPTPPTPAAAKRLSKSQSK